MTSNPVTNTPAPADAGRSSIRGLSAVFPCYNDEHTIGGLVDDVYEALTALVDDVEVIVVNDGSADGSQSVLDTLANTRPWLVVLRHERNRGYGQALISGFSTARHEWIFYTDGDAQYDASEAALLVPLAGPDVDIVQGYKIGRGDPWYRKVIGRTYHHVVKALFRLHVRDTDCDFQLVPPRAVHRPAAALDQRSDLRGDDALVRTGGRTLRGDAGTPLHPAVGHVAVLPASGHRPQRPPTRRTVVDDGGPWALTPGPLTPGVQAPDLRAGR